MSAGQPGPIGAHKANDHIGRTLDDSHQICSSTSLNGSSLHDITQRDRKPHVTEMTTKANRHRSTLTLAHLKTEAKRFIAAFGQQHRELFGVTDGKAVGTYVEAKFNVYLQERYTYTPGNAATGIDFPELGVDVKATSIRQPQSSCPFRSAEQKVYGLGYNLLVFVYEKQDNRARKAALLDFKHIVFISKDKTADHQTTAGLLGILSRDGNEDDVIAFLEERNLPLDEIGRQGLAERILKEPPQQGCLTISNALQWRLQYGRAITVAASGTQQGVENLLA